MNGSKFRELTKEDNQALLDGAVMSQTVALLVKNAKDANQLDTHFDTEDLLGIIESFREYTKLVELKLTGKLLIAKDINLLYTVKTMLETNRKKQTEKNIKNN